MMDELPTTEDYQADHIESLKEQLKASNAFTGELMEERDEWKRRYAELAAEMDAIDR